MIIVWTDEMLAALKTLFDEKKSLTRIAKEIGVSRSATTHELKKLGWYTTKKEHEWTPEHLQILRDMWKDKHTQTHIAKILGVHRSTVCARLKKEGLYVSKIQPIFSGVLIESDFEEFEEFESRELTIEAPKIEVGDRRGGFAKHKIPEYPVPTEPYTAVTDSEGVAFEDYNEKHDCRWPIAPGKYCGKPRIEGDPAPYCVEHRSRAFKPFGSSD